MELVEGYSIWLMPKGEDYTYFKSIIDDLSAQYKGPGFEPHITLLGQIKMDEKEVLERANQLAQVVKPLIIKLNKVEYLDEYYRCVFARAEEEYELMKANDIARRFFYMEDKEFMPHLSLLYGDYDEKLKKDIVSKLEIDETIKADTLYVVRTQGGPDDWEIIKEIKFR